MVARFGKWRKRRRERRQNASPRPMQQAINNKNSLLVRIRNLFFAKHHMIEHFGMLFGVLAFGILLCFGFAAKYKYQYDTQVANSTALYTPEFTTSKSQVTADVKAVYVNRARTRCFLLFKFSDISQIPLDVKKYQFFMCGENGHEQYAPIQGAPAGAFYIFGGSGYMGLYLINESGFKPQVLNLVGRINSQIISNPDGSETGEGAFRKYDQFRIRFNPGARGAKELPALEGSTEPSVSGLYAAMILNRQEAAAKKQLRSDINSMQIDLNNISDYKSRLQIYDHIAVPKGPGYVRGDKVATHIVNGRKMKYLDTTHIMSGGFDLAWQKYSIEQGLANREMRRQHMDPSMSIGEFISKMAARREALSGDSDTDAYYNTNLPDKDWKYQDGKQVHVNDDDDDSSTTVNRTAQLNNDIQGLESAWDKYIDAKEQYQGSDMNRLLNLENTYRQINHFSVINDSPHILTLY